MSFKINKIVREEFTKLKTKEEKDKFIEEYRAWSKGRFAQMLLESLEKELGLLIKDSESVDARSEWEFNLKEVKGRAKRNVLRQIIKELTP
jgi:hypothetical protein